MTVVDRDRGYAAMTKRIWGFKRPTIAVGILAGAGASQQHIEHHEKHGQEMVPDREPMTLLQIAIWNEFGTEDSPARAFVRGWYDENEARLRKDLSILMKSVIRGERTKEQVLDLLALRCVGEIQQRMADGLSPENAQSTIDRKGSSKPTIDSGQLRSGVTSRVDYG